MRTSLPLALLLGLTGCQCNTPKKAAPDAAKVTDAAKAAPDAAPTAPEPAGDIGQLFPPQPGLPAPLEGFSFKKDKATLTAAFPQAVTDKGAPVEGFPGVMVKVRFHHQSDRPRYASLIINDALSEALKASWPEGTPVKGPGGNDLDWIGPDEKTQYVLSLNTFAVWPVMDWREFLGSDSLFGFEKPERPLLGAKKEQVMEAYAEHRPRELRRERVELRFPPQPLRTSPSRVVLQLKDDVVQSVRVKLYHSRRRGPRRAMHTELTTKYGAPESDTHEKQVYALEVGGQKAKVEVQDLEVTGFLTVQVNRAE